MILIINKNELNKKFLPMISIVKNEEELKKSVKKQLITEIIENPENIRAYKDISVWKTGEVNEDFDMKLIEKEKIFTYTELLLEIIENLTEGIKGD